MTRYILSMGCVSGDDIQIAIHEREHIVPWLKKIDHEGSSWTVVAHDMDGDIIMETTDITDQIMEEYGKVEDPPRFRKVTPQQLKDGYIYMNNGVPERREYRILRRLDDGNYAVYNPSLSDVEEAHRGSR